MHRMVQGARFGIVGATMMAALPAAAQSEIQLWHALAGELGQKLEQIATDFNGTQKEVKIVPIYKGTYAEVMTGAIAAYRAKQPPHIVQIFEVGTATMMAAKGAVYPVQELMRDQGERFDAKAYIPALASYYSDVAGNMISLPFNAGNPVLYYNKDLFKKAGLNPDTPPKTWPEMETAIGKLQASGVPCGFTTEWPSFMQIETVSAWHNAPVATNQNGMGGLDTKLEVNGPIQVRHLENLVRWQKTKAFDYGGRGDSSKPKFFSGECGMTISSAAARTFMKTNMKSEIGIAMLPYYPDVKGAPQNGLIGGASLWVLRGHKPAEYKGVAGFLSYLSGTEVQAKWHRETGYLPVTQAAYELGRSSGYYEKNPDAEVALKEITLNPPTENTKGLRLGNFLQIRSIIEEEMEAALQEKKSPKEALDNAVLRGNEVLRQFERTNK